MSAITAINNYTDQHSRRKDHEDPGREERATVADLHRNQAVHRAEFSGGGRPSLASNGQMN